MSSVIRGLIVLTLGLIAPVALIAQATQAARGAAPSQEELTRLSGEVAFIQQAIAALAAGSRQLEVTTDATLRTHMPQIQADIAAAIDAGTAALAASSDPNEFPKLAAGFRDKVRIIATQVPAGMLSQSLVVRAASPGPPQIYTAVPDVVFTIGIGLTGGPSAERYAGVDLQTNLIGAAASVIFDALDEKKLAEYLKNNLASGVGFPTNRNRGKRTLTNAAGIGLGEAKLGTLRVWPVLGTEQTDTTDLRVPRSVVASQQGQKSWSTPTLAVAALPEDWLLAIRAGKLRPIVSLGIRFPQYYPGDPYQAIAALFSSNREKYRRAGGYRFTASVAVPLLKVKGP
jgi:hypothetical protein